MKELQLKEAIAAKLLEMEKEKQSCDLQDVVQRAVNELFNLLKTK